MQPDTLDDLTTETGGQQILIDGQTAQISTGFGNQVIMLQPPSSAAKVIGILLIIYGAFNAISCYFLLEVRFSIRDQQGIDGLSMDLNVVFRLISIGTAIIGGIWMMNYQRKGVYLVLIGL